MKRKGMKFVPCILVAMILLALVMPGRSLAASNVIELSYASPFAPDYVFSMVDKAWMAKIEKETNGRVKFKAYWNGSMMNIREAVDELATGVADTASISPNYAKSGFAIGRSMFCFFYGANNDVGRRVVKELLMKYPEINKEYEDQGIKVLSWTSGLEFQLLTSKKPVRAMGDLRGMRIKTIGELVDVLKELGAEGIGTPMTEVYLSMQKNVLDGALVTTDLLKNMSFAEVGKYCTVLNLYGVHQGLRAISMKTWNKLPPDIKKVFEDNIEYWGSETDKAELAADDVGTAYGKKMGVEFIKLSPSELGKFYAAMQKQAIIQAKALDAKGLPGTKIYNDAQRLIKLYSK